jgi:hypothetical protein
MIKTLIKKLLSNRKTSYPFISGDSFRDLADHIYEDGKTIKLGNIKDKEIIFVDGYFLKKFVEEIHPQIENRYVLITHNADVNIDNKYFEFIDEKIIHWFAQNNISSHPKITPIPIGIENSFYNKSGKLRYFKNRNNKPEKNKIFVNFEVKTNTTKRPDALKQLEKSELTEINQKFLNQSEHFERMSKYKFIASPEGNGVDCHRTWESLYFNSIPIVEKQHFSDHFNSIGIPLFLIDSWSDLDKITENDLELFYEENHGRFNCEPLFMDYWIKQINDSKVN